MLQYTCDSYRLVTHIEAAPLCCLNVLDGRAREPIKKKLFYSIKNTAVVYHGKLTVNVR